MTVKAVAAPQPAMTRPRVQSALDLALAVLVGLLAFGLYLRTLAPGLLWGDSAEFQFAAWLGGFTHPTGYPLYLSLGWLWTHLLPWQDPAWRMNLFSALWGAVATGLFYLLARRLLPDSIPVAYRRLTAVAAACVFAVTPTFWSQAVVAEVYSLHAVFVTGVLWALLRWAEVAGEPAARGRAAGAAVLYGLSLTHHRTMVLLAPAILIFVWQTLRAVPRSTRRGVYGRGHLAVLGLCLFAPLLLYLYIPLAAPHTPYFQVTLGAEPPLALYDATFAGFIAHVTGSTFGSALGLGAVAQAQVAGLGARFIGELTWLGVTLGLLGVAWGVLVPAQRRRPATALLGLTFLAVIAFNLIYGIGDIHVFFIPAYLVWVLWAALGAGVLARFSVVVVSAIRPQTTVPAVDGTKRFRSLLHLIAPLLLLLLAALLLTENLARNDRSGDQTARTTWEGILTQPIPQGSLLLSNDRDEMVPQWYLKYVEGVRPDIVGVFPGLQPGSDWADISQVTTRVLRTGAPVYYIKLMPGLEVKFQQQGPLVAEANGAPPAEGQLGRLIRVIGRAVEKTPDRPLALNFGDALKLTGYDVQPVMATAGGTLAVTLYWQPQRELAKAYSSFVHVVDADGTVLGQSDHRPGGAYYPTNLWRPGEVLRDVHHVTLNAAGRAPYSVIAGAYTVDPDLQHLGSPQTIGRIAPARAADEMPADVVNRPNIVFGDQLALLGYVVTEEPNAVVARLYWQAVQLPAIDYSVFVHVVDAEGQIVAQQDQQPGGGKMPPSTWPNGYTLADEMAVRLPANLPPGTYRLNLGVYAPLTMARLPAADAAGRPLGDNISLGELIRRNE